MPSVSDLSRLIPLSAHVTLDVGCGLGELGAAYRRLNPNARLLAIDIDPAMVAASRAHYDECAIADARDETLPFATPDGIDCIVYSAVLEHLADPFEVLARHAELLSPDGVMLLRVANPRHWRQAERLLRPPSSDDGPPNHALPLQAGLETVAERLSEIGLVPIDVQPRVAEDPAARAFIEAITPALRNLDVEPADYARAALPVHYIWRVRRTPVQRLVIAGDMLAPVGGVSHLRVIHPLGAMATDPAVVTHFAPIGNPPDTQESWGAPEADVARIFIMHRPALFGAEGQRLINAMIDKGWLVVTEFDDHPDFMRGLNNPAIVSFRGVHAVQTSTPELARIISPA